MEGAHKQQRLVSDAIIVGDKVEAAKRRRRAQHGAAAAGRRGESINDQGGASAQWCYQPEGAGEGRRRGDQGGHGIGAGVARAPLDEAERSWDKFVAESGMKVRGYPTVKQVLM